MGWLEQQQTIEVLQERVHGISLAADHEGCPHAGGGSYFLSDFQNLRRKKKEREREAQLECRPDPDYLVANG